MALYKKVSIIIPAYNEKKSIRDVVERVLRADVLGLDREVIVVDNCSTDGTREIIAQLIGQYPLIHAVFHEKNEGVGASWRDGIRMATGQIILRQDADTEYQPEDFPVLLKPILDGKTKIVFGSRLMNISTSKYRYKTYLWGGRFINGLINVVLGIKLTDVLTASKVFDKDILKKFSLESVHFEIEAELTAKATRAGFRITEVPVTYRARSFEEGKKIRWHHTFRILRALVYYRFAALN